MRAFVIKVIAVALGVWVTPYIASIIRLNWGLAEIGVLLVVVFLIELGLSSIPVPHGLTEPARSAD